MNKFYSLGSMILPARVKQRLGSSTFLIQHIFRRGDQTEILAGLQRADRAVNGFTNKSILDLGCDVDGFTMMILDNYFSPKSIVGINPVVKDHQINERIHIEQSWGEKTALPANSIDIVYSYSAFEHIANPTAVLSEMHRVLKPGGFLYAHFGPLWSSSYGHHLSIEHDGRALNYHNVILPAWCHLIDTEEDVVAACTPSVGHAAATKVANYVFHSPDQCRMLFTDFEKVFRDSEFSLEFFKGYDYLDLANKYDEGLTSSRIHKLKAQYGDVSTFLYDGIEVVLRK
jgi:ubiquinone/menaquinone biosynthesis C-methylase UbiE